MFLTVEDYLSVCSEFEMEQLSALTEDRQAAERAAIEYSEETLKRAEAALLAARRGKALIGMEDIEDSFTKVIAGPQKKSMRLSEKEKRNTAYHEAGHALQYAKNYAPIKIRMAILPACNIASGAALPLFLIGLFVSMYSYSPSPVGTAMMYGGIIAFSVAMLFQLVTLPVEFNASRRAMKALEATGYYTEEELDGARRVLRAAAMTYVAALATSLLTLLRLLLIASNGRRRR